MALAKGSKAPDFKLKTKHAEGLSEVSLSEATAKGKVVLLFFPLAFTSVCQEELCSVSAGMDDYASLGGQVFGISVDSPFAQEGWAKQNKITVTLLSDFNKEVAAAYDVLYEDLLGFKGVAKRSAFVIGEDSTILYSWSSEDPHNLPPFEEVKQALQG